MILSDIKIKLKNLVLEKIDVYRDRIIDSDNHETIHDHASELMEKNINPTTGEYTSEIDDYKITELVNNIEYYYEHQSLSDIKTKFTNYLSTMLNGHGEKIIDSNEQLGVMDHAFYLLKKNRNPSTGEYTSEISDFEIEKFMEMNEDIRREIISVRENTAA